MSAAAKGDFFLPFFFGMAEQLAEKHLFSSKNPEKPTSGDKWMG
jgi:hypothetical protein